MPFNLCASFIISKSKTWNHSNQFFAVIYSKPHLLLLTSNYIACFLIFQWFFGCLFWFTNANRLTSSCINLFQFDCYFSGSSTSSSQSNRSIRFCVDQLKIFTLSNYYFFQLMPVPPLYCLIQTFIYNKIKMHTPNLTSPSIKSLASLKLS